ncbi:RNA 2',3'-cyclic phosphodiesterase [Magnetovibrio sp.]|uniref:RNA 2',3'-cyclic phosphodiesterase n=1 Tax=Magnetovibrio sp. TaxID=2024836 RepID=UPI002F94DA44
MVRLFVGIALPESHRHKLASIQNGIKDARWVDTHNLHMTLRFIGDVDESVAEDIAAALDAVRAEPFALTLKNIGTFGRPPHSLWIGAEDSPLGALAHLQSVVESIVVRTGQDPEGRKFSPHVTLARFKKTIGVGRLGAYVEAHAGLALPAFDVTGFTLFESHLSHLGAQYAPYAEYDL